MKKLILTTIAFSLSLGTTTFAQEAKDTDTQKISNTLSLEQSISIAPADRYFGQTQMSILGLANVIKDLTIMAASKPDAIETVLHKAEFAEDALHDWSEKFPADPWLPKYAHNLVTLYEKCTNTIGKQHRIAAQDWLNGKFPDSEFSEPF